MSHHWRGCPGGVPPFSMMEGLYYLQPSIDQIGVRAVPGSAWVWFKLWFTFYQAVSGDGWTFITVVMCDGMVHTVEVFSGKCWDLWCYWLVIVMDAVTSTPWSHKSVTLCTYTYFCSILFIFLLQWIKLTKHTLLFVYTFLFDSTQVLFVVHTFS